MSATARSCRSVKASKRGLMRNEKHRHDNVLVQPRFF